jgi:hypothetical protein
MLKLVKQYAPWLDWKIAGIITLAAVGLAVCFGAPMLGLLAGIAPILMIAACLIPCLIPLALLRRKGQNLPPAAPITIPLNAQQAPAATCACGSDSCGISESATACRSDTAPHTA